MVQGDLEQMDDISRIARQAVSFTGRLDGLVNNASAFFPTPVSEASEDDWNTLMNANLKAPLFLVQACLPALRQHRGGVVNMIDIYAERPLDDHPIYCASKAGLAALTRSLAKDLAPDIRVNGVSPGAILWPEQKDAMVQEHKDRILGKTPLQRTGDPTDIARTIAFLLCDAPYITGHIIPVDGGRSLSI
jgi:pteridine reductase